MEATFAAAGLPLLNAGSVAALFLYGCYLIANFSAVERPAASRVRRTGKCRRWQARPVPVTLEGRDGDCNWLGRLHFDAQEIEVPAAPWSGSSTILTSWSMG
jgi:hypothetical protein